MIEKFVIWIFAFINYGQFPPRSSSNNPWISDNKSQIHLSHCPPMLEKFIAILEETWRQGWFSTVARAQNSQAHSHLNISSLHVVEHISFFSAILSFAEGSLHPKTDRSKLFSLRLPPLLILYIQLALVR